MHLASPSQAKLFSMRAASLLALRGRYVFGCFRRGNGVVACLNSGRGFSFMTHFRRGGLDIKRPWAAASNDIRRSAGGTSRRGLSNAGATGVARRQAVALAFNWTVTGACQHDIVNKLLFHGDGDNMA